MLNKVGIGEAGNARVQRYSTVVVILAWENHLVKHRDRCGAEFARPRTVVEVVGNIRDA